MVECHVGARAQAATPHGSSLYRTVMTASCCHAPTRHPHCRCLPPLQEPRRAGCKAAGAARPPARPHRRLTKARQPHRRGLRCGRHGAGAGGLPAGPAAAQAAGIPSRAVWPGAALWGHALLLRLGVSCGLGGEVAASCSRRPGMACAVVAVPRNSQSWVALGTTRGSCCMSFSATSPYPLQVRLQQYLDAVLAPAGSAAGEADW